MKKLTALVLALALLLPCSLIADEAYITMAELTVVDSSLDGNSLTLQDWTGLITVSSKLDCQQTYQCLVGKNLGFSHIILKDEQYLIRADSQERISNICCGN